METISRAVESLSCEVANLEVSENLEIVSDYAGFLIDCRRIDEKTFKFSKYEKEGKKLNYLGDDIVSLADVCENLENYLEIAEDEDGEINATIKKGGSVWSL